MSDDGEDTTVAGSQERSPGSGRRRPYLIVMSGRRFGYAMPVTKENVLIGRDEEADLFLDEDGVSRHHAKVVLLSGNVCLAQDLGSTNGLFVNDERVEAHPLEHGDSLRLGESAWLRFSVEDKIEAQLRAHLFEQATSDALTGLKNRKAFDDHLKSELAYSKRHSTALSLILFDADHFKRVNDELGHQVGDLVLKELAQRVGQAIRTEDHFSRIGGEEFALVLRGIDPEGALLAAERVRKCIAATPVLAADHEIELTISLGCVTYAPALHGTTSALVQEADEQLYRSKERGRNCSSQKLEG